MLSDRDLIEALLAPEASPTLSSFWATVASVSPLRVIPVGEEEPVPVSSSLVAVSVGNVVFCMILGNQLMIMGSASQDDPNELVIGDSPYVKITGTNVTNGTTTKTWANILAANPASMSEAEAKAGTATTARTLAAARLKVAAAVHGTPTGMVAPFAGSSAPDYWLMCDGAAVSRTTYEDLFATIGTTYGEGDGSTTFNVPDLRGRMAVGYDSAQTEFAELGKTGGSKTRTLSTGNIPNDSIRSRTIDSSTFETDTSNAPVVSTSGRRHKYATNTASPFSILNPYLALNYIIKT